MNDNHMSEESKEEVTEATAPTEPVKLEPSLSFASSISFRESVTDEYESTVGKIVMTSVGNFEFSEAEGVTLTGAQMIAIGTRLSKLEKSFKKLNLPD